jgi:UDP-N-acetyl-D-glucosamine dehydrogenase
VYFVFFVVKKTNGEMVMAKKLMTLQQKIDAKKAVVGILGLGYVGLPLAREFATAGVKVLGFDIDDKKIKKLNSGKSILKTVSNASVKQMVASKKFSATTNMARMKSVDAVLICVPTPLTESREPDMQYVETSCWTISKYLQKGQLISLESTTYPGTTRELMKPILETSGLKAGTDFYLAYSPEREDPGNKNFTTKTIPKVVGGLTPVCKELAKKLYSFAIDTMVPVSSLEAAESAKIVENVYRCINIAMVNELKMVFDRMGIDVWEVIRAGQYQALRLPAVLSRPRTGRPLHPDRPVLPDLESPSVRYAHAVYRIGRRDQYGYAALCCS